MCACVCVLDITLLYVFRIKCSSTFLCTMGSTHVIRSLLLLSLLLSPFFPSSFSLSFFPLLLFLLLSPLLPPPLSRVQAPGEAAAIKLQEEMKETIAIDLKQRFSDTLTGKCSGVTYLGKCFKMIKVRRRDGRDEIIKSFVRRLWGAVCMVLCDAVCMWC